MRVIEFNIAYLSDQPILHKTFHRYVVRAKRGTVQSQHDSAGRNARSAGANIRRHQEQAFKDVIKKIQQQQQTKFFLLILVLF